MSNDITNPCIFKRQCKECTKTDLDDRPAMCASLRCEYYTPCKKCGDNKTLNDKGLCNVCVKGHDQKPVIARMASGDLVQVAKGQAEALQSSPDASDVPHRTLSVTIPGTTPAECSESEKEYYNVQWKDYTSYYRDPTAKAIVHNIILLEIELNWLVSHITNQRGAVPLKEFEAQRTRTIHNLTELHGMLPKREATDESDDERFFSMVYERYIQEKKLRYVGKVARIISPEALALAPHLDFPVDPQRLLSNLGYRTLDIVEACDHIVLEDLPEQPTQMLEWMGFFLNEQYALPMNREPDIVPVIAEPLLLEEDEAIDPESEISAESE